MGGTLGCGAALLGSARRVLSQRRPFLASLLPLPREHQLLWRWKASFFFPRLSSAHGIERRSRRRGFLSSSSSQQLYFYGSTHTLRHSWSSSSSGQHTHSSPWKGRERERERDAEEEDTSEEREGRRIRGPSLSHQRPKTSPHHGEDWTISREVRIPLAYRNNCNLSNNIRILLVTNRSLRNTPPFKKKLEYVQSPFHSSCHFLTAIFFFNFVR